MLFNWFREKSANCPNCKLNWDGEKCIHCGYIERLANPELLNHVIGILNPKPDISKEIMGFFDPTLYSPESIYSNPELVPDEPGVYGWYFTWHFGDYLHHGRHSIIKVKPDSSPAKPWYLLYIGITGLFNNRSLRKRIYGDHLKQNSKGSTLRKTLSSILCQELNLNPAAQLRTQDEKDKLNAWMFNHARVTWLVSYDSKFIEDTMLEYFGHCLLFNLKKNKINPCRADIERFRMIWEGAGK